MRYCHKIIRNDEFDISEEAALKVIAVPRDSNEVEYLLNEGFDEESITKQFHGYVADIVREYKLMIGLRNCPNIVHCDDCRVEKNKNGIGWNVYIKMELLTPLTKVLDQVNTEQQIARLGKDLCHALAVCQKHNILHRDIKPQNIFQAPDGNFKLGDFGIARTAERTTYATKGIGTPSFMAPEVENGEAYGPAADIYSLGLVLYWFLNERRLPFLPLPPEVYTANMAEDARKRRIGGERLPEPVNGSEALKKIVIKACDFDPKKRFGSAEEMFDAFCALNSTNMNTTSMLNFGTGSTLNSNSNSQDATQTSLARTTVRDNMEANLKISAGKKSSEESKGENLKNRAKQIVKNILIGFNAFVETRKQNKTSGRNNKNKYLLTASL